MFLTFTSVIIRIIAMIIRLLFMENDFIDSLAFFMLVSFCIAIAVSRVVVVHNFLGCCFLFGKMADA